MSWSCWDYSVCVFQWAHVLLWRRQREDVGDPGPAATCWTRVCRWDTLTASGLSLNVAQVHQGNGKERNFRAIFFGIIFRWLQAVWVSSLCPSGFFGMWTFSRSNKQTGPPSKKVTEVPNIRMLELTGDLIGHSGAVQVRLHDRTNSFSSWRHSSVLTISSARVSDVCELRGERFGHVFGGSPADPVEGRREAVSPAQPGTVRKAGGERRTLTFNL